jgi:transposase
MIFVGLDSHKRYVTACAIDADGQLIAEERRVGPDLAVLSSWLGRLTGPVTVVLEATLYWAWLEQQLTALGYTVQVAHPYQVKLIWHARTKTDPIDARKLAELARVHLLPAIWIPDPATRAQRQLLRGRAFLVRQRTVLKNRIHAYLTAENLRSPAVDLYGRAGRAWLATAVLPPVVRRYVDLLLANLDLLSTQILALDNTSSATLGTTPSLSGCRRFLALGPSVPSCCKRRSGPSRAYTPRRNWPLTLGSCPEHTAPAGKPITARWPRQPLAQVDRRRNHSSAQTGARSRGRTLSKAPAREGKAQGHRRRSAQIRHLSLLDLEEGVELHRVASTT